MIYTLVHGKNCKDFVRIDDIKTKQDFEIHDLIKSVLTRKEYKPFIQSFNKTITESYLFNDIYFPVQFWHDVKTKVREIYGIDITLNGDYTGVPNVIEREQFDMFVSSLKLPPKYQTDSETYKYQQDCVYNVLTNKIGLIEIGTSGGKTFITYLYVRYILEHYTNWVTTTSREIKSNLQKGNRTEEADKILVIVPSKQLAIQLKQDFEEYSSLEEKKVIVESIFAGAKKTNNAHVICGTYQTLCNYEPDFFEGFRYIICDELHRAKAFSIKSEIYGKIRNADFYFGMTGTLPKYNTLDYLHITAMFGNKLYEKSVRSLIDDGISVDVDMNIIRIQYEGDDADYSLALRERGIIGTEKYRAEKEFFQSNEKRNALIIKLLKHYNSNALILVDTLSYCDNLYDLLVGAFGDSREIHIINGQVKNRQEIIDKMKQAKSDFILIGTYGTMSTGVSIPSIEQIYFVDGGKSEIRIRQSIGRGIRLNPGKEKCKVFDFFDDLKGSSFQKHARERLRIYKEQKLPFKITTTTI